jgi:hypothetical protein
MSRRPRRGCAGIVACGVACGVGLLAGGCQSRPELTRRFERREPVRSPSVTHARVSAFVHEPAGPSAPDVGAGLDDRTIFTRRVILTVSKTDLVATPADRLDRLTIALALRKDTTDKLRAQFSEWNRFDTEHASVDLGKIKLQRTSEVRANVGAGPAAGAAVPVSGSVGYTGRRTMDEELSLRQRYVAISGLLTPGKAEIYQEGVVGIDLVGNASLEIVLRLTDTETMKVFRFGDLVKPDGRAVAPGRLSYDVIDVRAPRKVDEDIACTLSGTYELRHVKSGGRTVNEGDDHVVPYRGTLGLLPDGGKVVLIRKDELRRQRAIFVIANHDVRGQYLHLRGGPYGRRTPLLFESYEAATAFLNWIRLDAANRTVRTWPMIYGGGTSPFPRGGSLDHLGVYLLD